MPPTLADFTRGDRFAVEADVEGRVSVTCPPTELRPAIIGPHAMQVVCEVVARIDRPGHSRDAQVGLHEAEQLLLHMSPIRTHTRAMPADDPGRVAFSRARFEEPGKADRFFASRTGKWLVVNVLQQHRLPHCAHHDPFTTEVPLAGSFVASKHGVTESAVIAGPLDPWAIAWALSHFPSGYYTPILAERIELVHGPQLEEAPPLPHPEDGHEGSFHLYRRQEDGHGRLVEIVDTLEQARARAQGRPGTWLLARDAHHVFVH